MKNKTYTGIPIVASTDTYNNITETIYIEHFKTEHGLRRRFKPSRYTKKILKMSINTFIHLFLKL